MHLSRTGAWLSTIICLVVGGSCIVPFYDYYFPNTHLMLRMEQRRLVPINLATYRTLLRFIRLRITIESRHYGGPTARIAHNIEVVQGGLTFEFNNAGLVAGVRPTYLDVTTTLRGLDIGIVQLRFREMNFILFILNPDRSRAVPLATGRVFNADILDPANATVMSLDEIVID